MRRSTVVILLGFAVWTALSALAGWRVARTIRAAGSLEVSVMDADARIEVDLPAWVGLVILDGATMNFGGIRIRLAHDLHDWVPVIRTALDEMEGYDRVPLLEIRDGGDRVRLEKRGERLVLEIDGGRSERVRVTMRTRTLRQALARLES